MMQRRPPPPSSSGPPHQPPPPSTPSPTFSENQLPSVKSGFYSVEQELSIRSKTCRFIAEAGRSLKLPPLTTYTAMVLLQRFYAVHSFKDHDRFEVAVACILLAAKTEESPKKLTLVIQECHRLKSSSARKNGGSGTEGEKDDGTLDTSGKEFLRLKERTLLLERVILHTIGFELSIDHPHKFIGEFAGKLVATKQIEFIQPPENQSKIHERMKAVLVQNAISLANDSMQTYLCLQYPPKQIAAAVVYMSAQMNKMKTTTNSKSFLDVLNDFVELDLESLVSIVKQILELIADRKGVDKGVFSSIESHMESMRQTGNGGGNRDAKRQRTSK
jgi:cyclin T